MNYSIRPMQVGDIPQVTEVDREAFPTQWPPPSFKKDLERQVVRYIVAYEEESDSCHQTEVIEPEAESNRQGLLSTVWRILGKGNTSGSGTVTRTKQNILGYASMWLMVDEAHLTSIAVRETHRRQGIGELLIIFIIDMALKVNAQVVTLEVRASNIEAQTLYRKYGFSEVGVRRGYYSDDGEDAVIMTTEKIASDSYQARFQELKQDYVRKWGAIQGCLG